LAVLGFVPDVVVPTSVVAATPANKTFVFKIKTKDGGIVGNIHIQAKDMFAAIHKLKERYPGCEILEAREG
jgi:hypothetical protein